MERYDVTFGKQSIQVCIRNIRILYRIGIIGDDLRSESPADIDKYPSDLASADDTDGLTVDIKADQAVQAEIKIPGPDVCLVYLPA